MRTAAAGAIFEERRVLSKHVTYCTNSTITEAWTFVRGLPAPVNDAEMGALRHAAQKRLPSLKVIPSTVLVTQPQDGPSPPFWISQLAWDDGSLLARLGHRYLSVHYVKRSSGRYETFKKSLKPAIETWLKIYKDTYGGKSEGYPVDRIGFGYINGFEFPVESFDLSEHFKITFGVGVGDGGLLAFATSFRFLDEVAGLHITVNLEVAPTTPNADTVRVVAKISAENPSVNGISFLESDAILNAVERAKESAKTHFFDFATDRTHAAMGAQYASD